MALYLKIFLIAVFCVLFVTVVTASIMLGSKPREYDVFFRTLGIYILILAGLYALLYFGLGSKIRTIRTDCEKGNLVLVADNHRTDTLRIDHVREIKIKKHYNRYAAPTYMIVIVSDTKKYKALDVSMPRAEQIKNTLEDFVFEGVCKDTVLRMR